MDFITYNDRLVYLLEKIEKGGLSSPHEMADNFQCSERTIRRMISRLREKGFEIEYSKSQKKYYLNN
jgi:predicted DNA-binding transcriptional regulator YafY